MANGEAQLRHVADCVLRVAPDAVGTYLNTRPGSYEEQRTFFGFHDRIRKCLAIDAGVFSTHGLSLRGALAAAVYRHNFPSDPDFAGAGATALPAEWLTFVYAAPKGPTTLADDEARRLILLEQIGACVVNANPNGAALLVRSVPASPEERQAFQKLIPQLGPCLPSKVTFTIRAGPLRIYLAQPLLQKAQVAAGLKQASGSLSPG